MTLKGITAQSTAADINFRISDPFGYYGVIELRLFDANSDMTNENNILSKVSVSPDDMDYTFTGLSPETKYRVAIGCYEEGEDEGTFKIMDTMRFWTQSLDCEFSIESLTDDLIYYYVKIDDTYPTYSAKVYLLSNSGEDIAEEDVDLNAACARGGFSGSLDRPADDDQYSQYRLEFRIRRENSSSETVVKTARVKNPDYGTSSGGDTGNQNSANAVSNDTQAVWNEDTTEDQMIEETDPETENKADPEEISVQSEDRAVRVIDRSNEENEGPGSTEAAN